MSFEGFTTIYFYEWEVPDLKNAEMILYPDLDEVSIGQTIKICKRLQLTSCYDLPKSKLLKFARIVDIKRVVIEYYNHPRSIGAVLLNGKLFELNIEKLGYTEEAFLDKYHSDRRIITYDLLYIEDV